MRIDVVIWDSHPLALGATPIQVFIDGISQLQNPEIVTKSAEFQVAPCTPDFARETAEAIAYDGLPPIAPEKTKTGTFIFTNVTRA